MSPDPNFDLISDPDATPAPAVVQLTLAAAPQQVEPAGVVTYTVVISNTLADRTLTGLVVSDTLPLELAYWPAGEGEFSYLEAERRLEWAIGQLAAGATLTGTFQAQVLGAVSGQVITNTVAIVSEEMGAAVQASAAITITEAPCLGEDCAPTPTAEPPTATPTATPTNEPPCLGFECTPTPTATPSLCQDDEGCTPTPTATWTPTATPGPDEVWLTPGEGGVLLSADGRVQVEARPGAVSAPTLLRYRPQPRVEETPAWLTMHFGLEAQDEQGAAVTAFESLVSLTYRFAPGVALTETIRLYRWDDAAETWQALDSEMDVVGRQLMAWLDGPGLFGLGVPASLSYGAQHLPTVHGFVTDEWSGNSSLGYPLALPPGPGGLGLNLSLGYSSEGVNSIRQGLSSYDITATVGPTSIPGNTPTPTATPQHVNQDALNAITFNRQASFVGWGWSLSGLGQVTIALAHGGTPAKAFLGYAGGGFELKQTTDGWQTEPQSFVRIAHVGNMDSGNKWEVWSPDGAKYTFGGYSDTTTEWNNGSAWIRTPNCGQRPREMHLTEVLDTHGNRIKVTYSDEKLNVYCPDNGTSGDYVRALQPARIEYFAAGVNTATVQIDFNYLADRADWNVPGAYATDHEAFFSLRRLRSIVVGVRSSGSSFTTARTYTLTQDYDWFDSNYHDNKAIMRLTSITEQGKNGGALPAWAFGYRIGAVGTQDGWKNHTLLETANNGQGGSVTYSYANVPYIWMEGCGGNTSRYRVSQMEVSDGMGNVQRTVYDHQNPRAWMTGTECDNFEFGGYSFVRSQVQDGTGTLYRVVENSYHQRNGNALDPRKGKVYQQVTKSSAGTTLAQVGTLWNSVTTKGTNWVRSEIVTNTLGTSSQATTYEYLTTSQNNAQYGNVTAMRTYSDTVGTLYRSQETAYFPANTSGANGVYIVNRPAQVLLKDATDACNGETRYFYDNKTSYAQTPSKGDVTKVRVAQTSCGGSWADTGYFYDDWGNSKIVTDTLGHVTTTAYDTTAGAWPMLYALPTSMIAPLVGTTSYVWDKVLGQVTSVTDPNLATTSYSYDQWGRQTQVIEPGDDATNPTLRFGYTHYAGSGSPYWVKQEQKESGSNYLESRTFYDGMGRVVQTQAEAASNSQSILVNTQYQPLGVLRTSIPYTYTAGLGGYRTPDWTQAKTAYQYDALGRTTQVTQPDGTTVKSFYQDRKTAVLDALNRQTISETDAVGRLLRVQQYLGTTGGQPNWGAAVYAGATYVYDIGDRLTRMIGPDNAVANITYDLLGRKTSMSDPDMGAWSYAYDAVGNLQTQTDARNTVLWFGYDGLNRLTQKRLTNGNGTLLASYTYDDTGSGNKGKGRRTGMSAGSGSASWTYDGRGRMVQESKVISGTGGGTFVTQWSYDSADRMTSLTYPDGEVVNYTYAAQGLVKTAIGTNTYVGDTAYNVLGQVELRKLGSTAGILTTDYSYRSDNFRLQWLRTGTASPYESLQKLEYAYDAAGNVDWIKDYKIGNPQLQDFTYDALNRLTNAVASGGTNGNYNSETYGFDPNGNLTSKAGVSYTYGAQAADCPDGILTLLGKPHAVVTAGSNSYCYDQNGNMRRRKIGASTYTLGYDAENRLTSVSGAATASFLYDADGARVQATFGSGESASITNYVGQLVEVSPVYREDFSDGLAQGWTASSGTWAVTTGGYRQSGTANNTNAYRAQTQNQLLVYRWQATFTSGANAGMYLLASAAAGAERGNSYRVWQDATSVKIYESTGNTATQRASFTASNTAGQTHSYQVIYDPLTGKVQVWRDNVYLGSWTDTTPLLSGSYLSLRTDASNVLFDNLVVSEVVKYYQAGGQRIALRKNGAVSYLFGDHLGSTSVTADATGVRTGELWYKPWGENRGTPVGATPTTYRFTGQREDASIGLYFYNARYYDSSLGRFIQGDTIVPGAGNPQNLNRYSYSANNPLRYTDPTGHAHCVDTDCAVTWHPTKHRYVISPGASGVRSVAYSVVADLGGVNDLEAMSMISDVAAGVYRTWDRFMPEMGKIFTGSPAYGTFGLIAPGLSSMLGLGGGGCAGVGREPHDCPSNTTYFRDTGFDPDFRDNHNQPYHVWGYIAQTTTPGDAIGFELNFIMSQWGNLIHEEVQSKLNWDHGWGTSWQDWVLSEAGVVIGYKITYGLITSPAELGDTLRRDLGPHGSGSYGKLQWLESNYGKLRGSP